MNPGKEGQSWILPWDMATIHTSDAALAAMKATFPHVVMCFIPPRSTSYLQPFDVDVFRSFKSCIQPQASATLARSVFDGSFDATVMNKAWRRQSSTEWALRAIMDLWDENKAWSTRWRQLRARSDNDFREANELPLATCSRNGSSRSPLPQTLWNGPWQKRQKTQTTHPCLMRQHRLNSS